MSTMMTSNSHHCGAGWHVVRKTTAVDGNSLEGHQPLSDLLIGRRINVSSFCVTKEFIQGVKPALSAIVGSVLSHIVAMADVVVDWSIRRWLWRSVISVVARVLGVAILRLTRMHLRSMIIVTSCGSFAALSVARVLPTMLFWRS